MTEKVKLSGDPAPVRHLLPLEGQFRPCDPLLAEDFCLLCVRLGMELAGTRRFGEFGALYDLIRYPQS